MSFPFALAMHYAFVSYNSLNPPFPACFHFRLTRALPVADGHCEPSDTNRIKCTRVSNVLCQRLHSRSCVCVCLRVACQEKDLQRSCQNVTPHHSIILFQTHAHTHGCCLLCPFIAVKQKTHYVYVIFCSKWQSKWSFVCQQ